MPPSLLERILATVALEPGLTDRMLADRLLGKMEPQQSVNQACRHLEQRGQLARRKRSDNLIGNYHVETEIAGIPVPLGSIGAIAPANESSGAPTLLSEDDVKRHLETWLCAQGWVTIVAWGRTPGIDVLATRGEEVWVVEAKGGGSLPAMRVNYFLCMLGETLQRMNLPQARYSIALPDLPQFRRLWHRLPDLAKQRTGITAIFVTGSGEVHHDQGSVIEKPAALPTGVVG